MSADLVKIETNSVAGYTSGLDSFEIKPSIFKLVQPTSKMEDAVPGTFYNTLDGTYTKELHAIILTVSQQRSYYPAGNSTFSGPPICKSIDGIKPLETSEAIQASSCANCPKSKWLNNKKPECTESYRVLFLDPETLLPGTIFFSRRGLTAVRQFAEILKARIISCRNKGEGNFDAPDFQVVIKSRKDGIGYLPVFTDVKLHGKSIKNEIEKYAIKYTPKSDEFEEEFENSIDVPFETV